MYIESIARFVDSGISELGEKLGPIVWQFMPAKQFEADDFEAFLALLPKAVDGRKLRHVLDVRHPSFMVTEYLKLARQYRCASVFTDSDKFPSFADLTGDFVYARSGEAKALGGARRFHVLHQRCQGACARRSAGFDRAACQAVNAGSAKPLLTLDRDAVPIFLAPLTHGSKNLI